MKRVRIYPPCPECMDPEMKKGGDKKWIQKATKSIERRGTEGKCTGSNYGGPGCPPGSKQYNLAKTFRKMAKSRKKEYGGDVADQNVGIEEFGPSRLNAFKDYIAGQARNAFTQNVLMNMPEVYPGMYQGGGNTAHGYGYNPDLVDINQFLDQEEDINNQLRNSFNQLGDIMQLFPYMPTQWKAKTTFNRKNPDYKQNRATYREQEEGYKNWKRLNDIFAGFGQPYLQTGGDLPKVQLGNQPFTLPDNMSWQEWSAAQDAIAAEKYQQWLEEYNRNMPSMNPYNRPAQSNVQTSTSSHRGTIRGGSWKKPTNGNKSTTVTASISTGASNGTNTGSSTTSNQVSHDKAVGATTGSQDKATTVQERRGNATSEQRKKATGTTSKTETGTTSTEKKSEDRGYGYYGEQGYPSIIYPRMGFLNQRTGMLPLILDPNSTHIEEIKTRRALLPGNRIKKITFGHDLDPYGQYGQTQTPTTTTPTTTKPTNPIIPEDEKAADYAANDYGNQEPFYRDNERLFAYGGYLPMAQSGIDWKLKYEQDQDRFRDEVMNLPENFFTPTKQQNNMFAGLRDRFGDWRDAREERRADAARDDLKTTAKSYNPIMRAALLDPALGIATSIGRNRTMGDFDIADKTAYDAIGTVRHRPVMGDFDFNPTGRVLDPTKYAPVQNKGFSMKCGGKVRKFQQGGSYELTDQEIDDLIASGIGFEYLD